MCRVGVCSIYIMCCMYVLVYCVSYVYACVRLRVMPTPFPPLTPSPLHSPHPPPERTNRRTDYTCLPPALPLFPLALPRPSARSLGRLWLTRHISARRHCNALTHSRQAVGRMVGRWASGLAGRQTDRQTAGDAMRY